MKIKSKVILIVSATTVLLCAALSIVLDLSFSRKFAEIENNLMEQDLERIRFALENEEITLNKQSMDWGIWDDTYYFVENLNQNYIDSNLLDSTFTSNQLNVIAYVDMSGKVVWGKEYNIEEEASAPFSPEMEKALTGLALKSQEPGNAPMGVLQTAEGPLLVGLSQIMTSLGEGPPRGTIIMARFLDAGLIDKVSTITKLNTTFNTLDEVSGNSSSGIPLVSSKNPVAIQPVDGETLSGSILINDIYGQPYIVAGTQIPRDVHAEGKSMIIWFLHGTALIAFLVILVNVSFLDYFILSRIKILRRFATGISKRGNITSYVQLKGKDELAELGNELNTMLKTLEATHDRLAESESKYKLLVENQSDLLIEKNLEGKLLFANPAYCKLMGKSNEELLGTTLELLFTAPESLPIPDPSAPATAALYSEKRMLTQNGWRWIAWTGNKVLDKQGQVVSLTCLGRDITESKLAKDGLEKANQQLIELDKLKDNFLSTVSHELRTPLTSIKSFAEILLTYDEDKATQREFLGIINEESDRLTRLINDFLDLSKIQAGRMQWKTAEMAVSEAIHSAVTVARPLAEKNKLEIALNIDPNLPTILYDKDRLVQVITNVVGNAIKFTPENGRITISAVQEKSPQNGRPDMIIVSVQDTGIGIAPENHQKIFENFGQVGDVLKDRPKGTGLGLPICKKIIENYGGKIWIKSALGQGTTFLFSLPVAKKSAAPAAPAAEQLSVPTPAKVKTILVVDDEPNIRRVIEHELTIRGHHVIEAASGKEAVEMARKNHPDLITLDIAMPELNGIDVTAVLKNDPETSQIPILIISVFENLQRAYALGANDYITKPITIDTLIERVNRLLEIKPSQPASATPAGANAK